MQTKRIINSKRCFFKFTDLIFCCLDLEAMPRPVSPKRIITKTKRSSDSDSATVKRSGVYHSNDEQCAEITSGFGRCKNTITAGTTFCHLHQRKKMQHEDGIFDSTFAHVGNGLWIGSLDTANDPSALKAAGIKAIVNISGWEPRSKTRAMYKKLGIVYHTLTSRDSHGKLHYLGDEPIGPRLSMREFYNYMDRGVEMIKKSPRPVLIHCFTEEHQLLTNKGFMYLHEVEQYNGKDLLFASYDPATKQIVYDTFTLVVNQKQEHDMIEMTQNNESWKWNNTTECSDDRKNPSNNMSIIATEGHKMYVKHGLASQKGVYWKSHKEHHQDGTHNYVQNEYNKVEASALISNNERDCVKFLGVAREGIRQDQTLTSEMLPFIKTLSLKDEQINTFLELYGYWLGDGTMSFRGASGIGFDALVFYPQKDQDKKWLTERLTVLDIKYEYNQYKLGRHHFRVTDETFVTYFRGQYQHNYQCHKNAMNWVDSEENTQQMNIAKSGKWLWWWVWNLNKEQAQAILKGLRMADGDEANGENAIFTSSVRFRDEIVRLALHAGYSAHFILKYEAGACRGEINGVPVIANHDGWRVSYNIGPQYAEPNLRAARDIKRVKYNGRTWCVQVPHEFVIVRRARFDKVKGYITLASRPIICSNCHAGINRSASLIAAYLISQHKMDFAHARHYLIKANEKRSISVLTNRDFVSAMNRYAEYLRNKNSQYSSR